MKTRLINCPAEGSIWCDALHCEKCPERFLCYSTKGTIKIVSRIRFKRFRIFHWMNKYDDDNLKEIIEKQTHNSVSNRQRK